MAVGTLDGVHVVWTFGGFEGGVHGLDIDAAVREPRMASRARRARGLSVLFVASEATKPLVNANRCAVVGGSDLRGCIGRVALIAKSLALIRADLDRTAAFIHLRQRKTPQ